MDSEIARYITREIERQMNQILSGVAGNASELNEDVQQLYPSMPTITQRPVMHPYGISSTCPDGMISVIGKQGEHFGNRIVLGHRAKDRPHQNQGEITVYSRDGFFSRVWNDHTDTGSDGSFHTIHDSQHTTCGKDSSYFMKAQDDHIELGKEGDYKIRIFDDRIELGKGGTFEPMVMGETARIFLQTLVNLIIGHVHPDPDDGDTGPPTNAADFDTLRSENIDNSKILCKDGGRF